MPNTFSRIYVQTVFAVSERQSLIRPEFKEELYQYITGVVRNDGHKLISINGMPDHVHILIGLKPVMALADLVRDVPTRQISSTREDGFAVDSVGRKATAHSPTDTHSSTQSSATFKIRRKHHKRSSFKDEYLSLLRKFEIAFDDKYLFKFIE